MKPTLWIVTLCFIIQLQKIKSCPEKNGKCIDWNELNPDETTNSSESNNESEEETSADFVSDEEEDKKIQIQELAEKLWEARKKLIMERRKTAEIKKNGHRERMKAFVIAEKRRINAIKQIKEKRQIAKIERENAIKGIEKERQIATSNARRMKQEAVKEREEAVKIALQKQDEDLKNQALEREKSKIEAAEMMEKNALEEERRLKEITMEQEKETIKALLNEERAAYRREETIKKNALRWETRRMKQAGAAVEAAEKEVNGIQDQLLQLGAFETAGLKPKNFKVQKQITKKQDEVNEMETESR